MDFAENLNDLLVLSDDTLEPIKAMIRTAAIREQRKKQKGR
jgi:hypothetical protein